MGKRMQEFSDEEILKMLKSPDQKRRSKALNFLYDNMYASIARFILNNSGNANDAKDLFQDSLIVFFEKAISPDFELTGSIRNYLHAVCRNLWLKRLRKSGRELSTEDVQLYAEPSEELVYEEPDDEAQQFGALISQLGEGCRNILLLFYYERLSMKEIAKTLGLANEGVAKNKKARCIQKLKELVRSSEKVDKNQQ